jgi:hypothetical protein
MFRWDAQQRFSRRSGKAWIGVALASWIVVGALAEYRGYAAAARLTQERAQAQTPAPPEPAPAPAPSTSVPAPSTAPTVVQLSEAEKKSASRGASSKGASSPAAAAPAEKPIASVPPLPHPTQSSWQAVTLADIDRDLVFDRLPSDAGIVTPIAPDDEDPDPDTGDHLQYIREMLPSWQPGKVADPVQRVRNILYVAAVPDVLQLPIERFAPHAVFDRLQEDIPKDQLIKILYWIALHPTDGDDKAVDELWALKFSNDPVDLEQTRERAAIYAVKLLGRLLGKLPHGSSRIQQP